MSARLDRRTVLRGLGGVGIGLPFLEVMLPRHVSAAPSAPRRYVVTFAGMSLGRDNTGKLTDIVPDGFGTDFVLRKPAMAALEPLRDRIIVVSGLQIPIGGVGGRLGGFHKSSLSPLLSGFRAADTSPDCHGPTSDQVVAADPAFKGKTKFPHLVYRVQAEAYRGGGNSGVMSWRGRGQKNDPTVSPKLAFRTLFAGFAPTSNDRKEREAFDRLHRQQLSVMDLVRGDSERLRDRLGRPDQARLERHFDELRDLEKRIKTIADVGGPGASRQCRAPGAPKAIDEQPPALGEAADSGSVGYAGEEERAQAMTRILAKAFSCDLVRVAALQYTFAQCFMNVEKIATRPVKMDVHELAHLSRIEGGKDVAQSLVMEMYGWHIKHFANLATALADELGPDGRPLLDNTVMAFVNEGGLGPAGGKNPAAHSTDDMMVVLAGGAATGLKLGRHHDGKKDHPARVIASAISAAGANVTGLGEVSGRFEPAFTG